MKSFAGSAALFVAASLFNTSLAVEHPLLASTADYQETWIEKPETADISSKLSEVTNMKQIDHSKRPVIGVLTEPLRGTLHGAAETTEGDSSVPGYVPRPHVQFLEQAGIRVVPIDYRLSRDELVDLFEQINGLYLPGDSQTAVTNEVYRGAFSVAMGYAEHQAFEVRDHWPIFLMGNSLNTWVRSKQTEKKVLSDMMKYKHTSSRLDLVEHPDETYLFHKMTREEKQAVFNTAQFFNMQTTGLRASDLKYQNGMQRHLKPLALFTGHSIEEDEEKFIAIAEGNEMPLYAFTYGIEMVQFFFEDPSATLDNFQLDHSIIARKHAQTIASLIAAEARMNDHAFAHEDAVFENLIRHEELANISYAASNYLKELLPKGMSDHEVYILH